LVLDGGIKILGCLMMLNSGLGVVGGVFILAWDWLVEFSFWPGIGWWSFNSGLGLVGGIFNFWTGIGL